MFQTLLQVCENGVILTEFTDLRSSVCVCREQSNFNLCTHPRESPLYLLAPFWGDINNVSATADSSLTYQVFQESNPSHGTTLEKIWAFLESKFMFGDYFYPSWVLVAYWEDARPYIAPEVIDSRVNQNSANILTTFYMMSFLFLPLFQTNTFQAIVLMDSTCSLAIFTYNCTDLEWANTNALVVADCSFIGYYAGGNFSHPGSSQQITYRTANITNASCFSKETSWNNHIFHLNNAGKVN